MLYVFRNCVIGLSSELLKILSKIIKYRYAANNYRANHTKVLDEKDFLSPFLVEK